MKHTNTANVARNYNLSRAGKGAIVSTLALLAVVGTITSNDSASAAEKNAKSTTNTPVAKASNADTEIVDMATVPAVCPMTLVSVSRAHSLAVSSDGSLFTWGKNSYGELGDGTNVPRNTPAKMDAIDNVNGAVGGDFYTVVTKTDGTVWSWGKNEYGELGYGGWDFSKTPVQVKINDTQKLTNILPGAIASGFSHVLALDSNGKVWAWGDGNFGTLGQGNTAHHRTAVQVKTSADGQPINAISVAAGTEDSFAIATDHTIWAWGLNYFGRLGDGTQAQKNAPVKVGGDNPLRDVVQVQAGHFHTVALKSDGTVYTWGRNLGGELGDGTFSEYRLVPGAVKMEDGSLLDNVIAIAGGFSGRATVVLRADGTLWSWGENEYFQLGNGSDEPQATPKPVLVGPNQPLTGIRSVAFGFAHGLALADDGSLWSWGSNFAGQLGIGNYDEQGYAQKLDLSVLADASDTLPICSGGKWVAPPANGCAISGEPYNQGQANPVNLCQTCNSQESNISWTYEPEGTACADDGLAWTNDICDQNGECTHPPNSKCEIDGALYSDGDANPDNLCQVCDSGLSPESWTAAPVGTHCEDDENPATLDVCDPDGSCTHPSSGKCRIDGVDVDAGDTKSGDECSVCDPDANYFGWTRSVEGSCAGCQSDADCSGATPACSDSGECVECTESNTEQCNDGMGCVVSKNICEQCKTDADCDSPTPACSANGVCVMCSASNVSECGETQVCNYAAGVCVGEDQSASAPTENANATCACSVPNGNGSSAAGLGVVAMLLGVFGLRRGRRSESE